jgi:hypothetical protein
MFKFRMALVIIAALSVIACNDKTQINIDHSLQPTPPAPKPTADCTDSDVAVYQIFNQARQAGNPGFNTTLAVVLNDDVSCAVHILFEAKATAAQIGALAGFYQNLAKSYAFNFLGKGVVPLWYDMPPAVNPTMPGDDDCKYAAGVVKSTFANSTVTVVTNPRDPHTTTRCYIQAVFPDETSFKNFLTFNYPANSGQSDPFHVYHAVNSDTTHAVSVYGTEAHQN